MRGEQWQELVNRVMQLPEMHPEVLAFMLMMVRFDGCMACETDSYRAMRGCHLCAMQMLRRYKGSAAELIRLYERALADVHEYMDTSSELGELVRVA